MNYLLDTNACISYLNNPLSPIRSHLERLDPNSVFVCSVVKAELYFGVMHSQRPKRNREKAKRVFGHEAVETLEEGIRREVDWIHRLPQ